MLLRKEQIAMDKSLMDDTTFINFFSKPENIYAMEYFLECYLNLEEGSLKDHFQLLFEETLEKENNESKTNRVDILLMEPEIITNVEAYRNFGMTEMVKSAYYIFNLCYLYLVKKKEYQEVQKIRQINIVENLKSSILEQKCESALTVFPLTEMMEIVIIRLDLLDKVDYNHGERTKDYVTFLKYLKAKNSEERAAFESEGSIYKKMNEEIAKLIRSCVERKDFDHDAWNEKLAFWDGKARGIKSGEKHGIAIGKERGIAIGEERGIAIGEERGENKLIQKMISKGKSDEDIANTTEIDIKRIRELRASMT